MTNTLDGIWESLSQQGFMVPGTVNRSYVCGYLGQTNSATFDCIWDRLSQLCFMVSGKE
jgi:hypothetical protein